MVLKKWNSPRSENLLALRDVSVNVIALEMITTVKERNTVIPVVLL